jgi:hypothetical protein
MRQKCREYQDGNPAPFAEPVLPQIFWAPFPLSLHELNNQHPYQDQEDLMSDLYLGVLLVIGVMTLIFFGPELGKTMSRKYRRSKRRIRKSHATFKRGQRIRTRKVSLVGHFAHF